MSGDAAHVAFVPADVDEAFVSPLLAPTVLHDPVVLTLHGTVAESHNGEGEGLKVVSGRVRLRRIQQNQFKMG